MLEGVVQIVCPHCDQDNRIPCELLRQAPPCVACRGELFQGRPAPIEDERRFDKHVRHGDIPVLALFHAAWSSDSNAVRSVFEQAAPRLEPYARLVSVDGATVPDLAERLKVVRYPTLLLFHRERERARVTGAMNLAQLLSWARPLIADVAGRLPLPPAMGQHLPGSPRRG
jgi:thioredoxin 2